MKFYLFSLTFVLVLISVLAVSDDEEWNNFKQKYGKNYADEKKDNEKKAIYLKNKEHIKDHNKKYEAGESTYKLKINHFGDMSYEEYDKLMHPHGSGKAVDLKRKYEAKEFIKPNNTKLPDCLNWKDEGAVTPARDQNLEVCGSCWAHAAVGALEGQYFRKNGILKPLSVQNLIDCTREYGNSGCNGGATALGFQYVIDEGGIPTEAEYPYRAKNGKCPKKLKDQKEEPDVSFGYLTSGDEEEMKIAVATIGPLSTSLDASHNDFRFYSEGIYHQSDCDKKPMDHAVIIVGYCTDENNRDYWLVKNSFGADWGEDGFFKVYRNKDKTCGLKTILTYPIL